MKKYFTILLVIALSVSCSAQKMTKIKGNKQVVDVYHSLEEFDTVEISNGLEVSLKQGKTNDYHLETDSNLVDQIAFEIKDKKLHIYKTGNILSSRKLNIDLTVVDLKKITLNDGAEVKGVNKLESKKLTMIVLDDSEFKLDVKADELTIIMNDSSRGTLAVKGGKLFITLDDNATLKGAMTMNECTLEINKRSDFDMDGDVEDLNLIATGSTDIKASRLRSEKANVIASNNSDIYIHVTKNLALYAEGKSNIYVYGNPEIQVDGLNDRSQIIKK
jgi:hypothetical protein